MECSAMQFSKVFDEGDTNAKESLGRLKFWKTQEQFLLRLLPDHNNLTDPISPSFRNGCFSTTVVLQAVISSIGKTSLLQLSYPHRLQISFSALIESDFVRFKTASWLKWGDKTAAAAGMDLRFIESFTRRFFFSMRSCQQILHRWDPSHLFHWQHFAIKLKFWLLQWFRYFRRNVLLIVLNCQLVQLGIYWHQQACAHKSQQYQNSSEKFL